jgi:hypothetical protein
MMVVKIVTTMEVPGHSGTETRSGSSETGPHSTESRTTAEAAPSKTSTAKPAPSTTAATTSAPATMPSGHGNRGAQRDCCNAACEQNRLCLHNKLGFYLIILRSMTKASIFVDEKMGKGGRYGK